ncbi:hypothetical protein T484DRAFT_1647855, partial [Baffinella frigidus]
RHPEPWTRNPKPEKRNPTPESRDPKPETRLPKPDFWARTRTATPGPQQMCATKLFSVVTDHRNSPPPKFHR